jgi:hypothetical protein
VATVAFAGIVFGAVVATGALLAVWNQRRRARPCAEGPGPVDIEITTTHTGSQS